MCEIIFACFQIGVKCAGGKISKFRTDIPEKWRQQQICVSCKIVAIIKED